MKFILHPRTIDMCASVFGATRSDNIFLQIEFCMLCKHKRQTVVRRCALSNRAYKMTCCYLTVCVSLCKCVHVCVCVFNIQIEIECITFVLNIV